MAAQAGAAVCQVLVGMGGVGKTQLAAHQARRAWAEGELDLLVWISANTRAAIISTYAQAASDVLGADPTNSEYATRAFLAWLEPKLSSSRCRWLVVLDDVADPADLRGLWPPASPEGRTLVTTRRRDAALIGGRHRSVPVALFTPDEAVTYLGTALTSHGRIEPLTALAALSDDLGCLPLALSQAVAYLIDADLDCSTYRSLLSDRAQTLTELLPDCGGLPDDQPFTVAAAWSLSIDRADQLAPAGVGRPLLQLVAALDPNGIPASVLFSPPALAYLTEHSTHDCGRIGIHAVTVQLVLRALRILHRLSLIDHDPGNSGRAVRVHQLIQRATRESLSPHQCDQLTHTAADALYGVWPDREDDVSLAHALRANVQALTDHAEGALYRHEGVHAVLFRAGKSLGQAGAVSAAIDHFEHLVRTARSRLGPDHLDTFNARHNIAWGRGMAGHPAAAIADFAQLLTDLERMRGDGLNTFIARQSLAHWRGEAGYAAGAATDFAQLLADWERTLGPGHPETFLTRYHLARWRGEAGDTAAAVADCSQLLSIQERMFGRDDHSVLVTRHNLAVWTARDGNVAEAVAAFALLLADLERVLGADHPDTLYTRHCYAHWRAVAGDTAAAATDLSQLLSDLERTLGPDHPHTLATRLDLAACCGAAGDVTGAIASFVHHLAGQERVLGSDHSHTLYTRHCLAHWRGVSGDSGAAAKAFAQLLADRERLLGRDHPDTDYTRHCLAQWRGVASGSASATIALTQMLANGEGALGPHRHKILNNPYNYYYWAEAQPFNDRLIE
ncbi:tetratricopeptide repeat protein [Streptomyces sp. NBC_01007]|nr:tetratricopeptide repeat protein [Streptomyces sp. NBC_01007]